MMVAGHFDKSVRVRAQVVGDLEDFRDWSELTTGSKPSMAEALAVMVKRGVGEWRKDVQVVLDSQKPRRDGLRRLPYTDTLVDESGRKVG